MPGFFEALGNMPEPKTPKLSVSIHGQEHEVSADLFKEIMKHGEEQYHLVDGKIVIKQQTRQVAHSILEKADTGHELLDGDRYWPLGIIKGGVVWKR